MASGGRWEGCLSLCSRGQAAADSTEAPEEAGNQKDRWAGPCCLQAAGREEGRCKRPPWASSGASRAPLSEHRRLCHLPQTPSSFLGSCRSPAWAQKAQPHRHPSHPVPRPKPPQKCHPDSTTLGFVKVQGNNGSFHSARKRSQENPGEGAWSGGVERRERARRRGENGETER